MKMKKNPNESAEGGSLKLCPTRWRVRASCYERIIENSSSLFQVWKLCLTKKLEPDIKARILGCEYQMKAFDFFYGLHLSHRIFSHTDNLSKSLQSSNLSVTSSQHLVKLTLSTIESIRNETSFDAFFETILKKKKEYPEIAQPVLLRKRHAPIRFEVGEATPDSPKTEQDRYRQLYYEAIDLALTSVRERFDQPAFNSRYMHQWKPCYLRLLKERKLNKKSTILKLIISKT